MAYSYPRTAEEYWNVVDAHWTNLEAILEKFIDATTLKNKNPNELRLNRSTDLVRLFSEAWCNAPDNRSIHSIPSWGVLCDLCSESYVLGEDLGDE